jgi:chromate transporter
VTKERCRPGRDEARLRAGTVLEVFLAFLRLGLTSFGGPVAHLGYFHAEFVERRCWLDEREYSDLVALCQFLPGPSSSQVGIALGLTRAGWAGALAAWLAFTLPSALLLVLFGYGIASNAALAASGAIHGLKVAAVAIVAQAVWGMARALCPDRTRQSIAIAGALFTLLLPSAFAQLLAIGLAGLAGWRWLVLSSPRLVSAAGSPVSNRAGIGALVLFATLIVALPFSAALSDSLLLESIAAFYHAGSLVFGGGHVVLPLLEEAVVPTGLLDQASFVAGYGAAQAVPGPLFSFAAYLGTVMQGPLRGWSGGLLMLVAIYVPGFLLLVAALPFWNALRRHVALHSAIAGINAGVVGILLAALYDPIWTSAVRSRADFALALAGFALLVFAKAPPLAVVALAALVGGLLW